MTLNLTQAFRARKSTKIKKPLLDADLLMAAIYIYQIIQDLLAFLKTCVNVLANKKNKFRSPVPETHMRSKKKKKKRGRNNPSSSLASYLFLLLSTLPAFVKPSFL